MALVVVNLGLEITQKSVDDCLSKIDMKAVTQNAELMFQEIDKEK